MLFRSSLLLLIISSILTALLAVALLINPQWLDQLGTSPVLFALLLFQLGSLVLMVRYHWQVQNKLANTPAALLEQQRKELEQYQKELQQDFHAEAARLEQESRKLTDRYCTIHEWLDSPELLDLQSEGHHTETLASFPATSQQHDIAEKDRQVAAILDTSAEKIYEKIRSNTYAPHGPFDARLLRDDLIDIAQQIAHVYQPGLENPLLHTSPEQLARALNRIGLHLLAVMDQLPLDLKSYNIQQTYDTVRGAIKAYGAYQKASPYLNWATKGAYFGRVLASTNPITIGLMWGATELGKLGAKKFAANYIDRQAIGLMQSVVRVVGYEVASIYSDGFRYRDPNWCYGVELTQMAAAFPDSREKLQFMLQEVSRIQLRNEYDRLSLYRCVVAGKKIDRSLTHPELMEESERRKIIELLEKAHREVLHGTTSKQAEKWRQGVQEHLGLQLSLTSSPVEVKRQSEAAPKQILNCLITFLSQLRQYDNEQIITRLLQLSQTPVWESLGLTTTEEAIRQSVIENSPQEFIPPDIDPADSRIDLLIETLCNFYAEREPYSPEIEMMLIQFGLYYRRERNSTYNQILNAFQTIAIHQFPEISSLSEPPTSTQDRAILYNQTTVNLKEESPQELFPQVTVKTGEYELPGEYFVLLTNNGMYLYETGDLETDPKIIWKADQTTKLKNSSGVLTASASITGGSYLLSSENSPITEITLQAPMTARYDKYFIQLTNFIDSTNSDH